MWLLTHRTYIALFVGGLCATYLLVPLVRALGLRFKVFDPSSQRREDGRHVPTLGGIAVAVPLYAGIALLYVWPNLVSESFFSAGRDVSALLLGGLMMLALGLYDDLRGARPVAKLLVQVVAGIIVCILSGPIKAINAPLIGTVELGVAAVPLTVLWIVAITNAFNLIDGIDGLAAGVGIFVCATSFLMAHMYGHVAMMVFAAIMTGSLLAFLRFNFHPATIFLGDTGSMFVGFTIAVVSLQSSMKAATTVLLLIPVCVLGYPLLDASVAIARRFLKGKPIFSSDRSHIHHKFLAQGLGHRRTSAMVYALTFLFTVAGILHIYGRDRESGVLVGAVFLVLAVMFKQLGYWELVWRYSKRTLRRKYRICNLTARLSLLKMEDARSVDELWSLVCRVAAEYDLYRMTLKAAGAERTWQNPSPDIESKGAARHFELAGEESLTVEHASGKEEDIEFEQDLLLEGISEGLAQNLTRLQQGGADENGD